jgi:histidinol dehydrogenase
MQYVNWQDLTESEQKIALLRPVQAQANVAPKVAEIIAKVKEHGDVAVKDYTEQFDKVRIDEIAISPVQWEEAISQVSLADQTLITAAIARIKAVAKAQLPENWFYTDEAVQCQRLSRPIERVGLYVPGGTAPLISTVLMLAVPALVAGCNLRVLCTPPTQNGNISPLILFAAKACEVTHVYKVGGAQAIAAMAFGTQTILAVDKIFGPGNIWVTTAKQLCAQMATGVSIDMPAGPSELVVIADDSANPDWVAADLLSQAEHDPLSQVILLTPSERLARAVQTQLSCQIALLPRQAIAQKALEKSRIFIVGSINDAITISNRYAPEHLSLQVNNAEQYCNMITNAATVFLGHHTCEALGDYCTGSNHVLPTSGYARSVSGLSVQDFIKWVGFQKVTPTGLNLIGNIGRTLANKEGLQAHAQSIALRMEANNA